MPRPYPEEFRRNAVELARQREQPVSQIAAELGIAQSALHPWIRQADLDEGRRGEAQLASPQDARLRHPGG